MDKIDPYEADASHIPSTDTYWDLPCYGRYLPGNQDFLPDKLHFNSDTPESIQYWRQVLQKCNKTPACCIYDNPDNGRDVFAIGGIIIKSSHLREGGDLDQNFFVRDQNEIAAIQIAKERVRTPEICFAGKIDGCEILVQTRLPGVGLNVAWPYLNDDQKKSFVDQARKILQSLQDIHAPSTVKQPQYIYPDSEPQQNHEIQKDEYDILFTSHTSKVSFPLGLMHNDFQTSNIIVNNDEIVGVVDWEHAGWFLWDDVAEVHSKHRNEGDEYWRNLYSFDPSRAVVVHYPS